MNGSVLVAGIARNEWSEVAFVQGSPPDWESFVGGAAAIGPVYMRRCHSTATSTAVLPLRRPRFHQLDKKTDSSGSIGVGTGRVSCSGALELLCTVPLNTVSIQKRRSLDQNDHLLQALMGDRSFQCGFFSRIAPDPMQENIDPMNHRFPQVKSPLAHAIRLAESSCISLEIVPIYSQSLRQIQFSCELNPRREHRMDAPVIDQHASRFAQRLQHFKAAS